MSQSALQAWERVKGLRGLLCSLSGLTTRLLVSSMNTRKSTGANPFINSFDLKSYGSMQFPEQNVFCVAGFSEKVFTIMGLLEKDKKALVNEIRKVEFKA
jgi:hypothetical protein